MEWRRGAHVTAIAGQSKLPMVRELGADALSVAIGHGTDCVLPKMKGLDHPNVVTTMDLLEGRAEIKDSVVIGGGFMGSDIAQHIATGGGKVLMISKNKKENIGGTVGFFTRNSLFQLLDKLGVEIRGGVDYREVTDEGVIIINEAGDEELIPTQCVVIANGFKVDLDSRAYWGDCADEIYQVGNCIDPANINGTTRQANTAVYRIGA